MVSNEERNAVLDEFDIELEKDFDRVAEPEWCGGLIIHYEDLTKLIDALIEARASAKKGNGDE